MKLFSSVQNAVSINVIFGLLDNKIFEIHNGTNFIRTKQFLANDMSL
jgi:hypothetical protein